MNRLKLFSVSLGLAAVLGMAGVAGAKGAKGAKGAARHHGISGKIADITGDNQFTLTTGGKKNPQTITVTVNASTNFTVDGKSGSFKDLKKGDRVTIQPDANNPTKVIDKGQGHHNKPAK